jgi:hypothetical protein
VPTLSGIAITQVFLFAVSLYIAIASVMVFLSLVLSPTVNRWTNIVLPSLYVVSIVASAIGGREHPEGREPCPMQ